MRKSTFLLEKWFLYSLILKKQTINFNYLYYRRHSLYFFQMNLLNLSIIVLTDQFLCYCCISSLPMENFWVSPSLMNWKACRTRRIAWLIFNIYCKNTELGRVIWTGNLLKTKFYRNMVSIKKKIFCNGCTMM